MEHLVDIIPVLVNVSSSELFALKCFYKFFLALKQVFGSSRNIII